MLEITHPTEYELESTLQFVFGHLPPSEQALRMESIMQQYHAGRIDVQGIIQAKHDGNLVGAMYAQTRPDASVMLWIPTMKPGFPLEPMFESLIQFCQSKNAFAAIAIADRDQTFDERLFCAAGQFRYLSDLVYLVSELSSDEEPEKPYRLQFVPLSDYPENISDRLTRLVKATYYETLDFPELMQIAPVEQVLQGYKMDAPYRPELWFFIRQEDVDIGVLFLTDAGPEQYELTYMGLVPSARRQGFSREIIRFAKRMAVLSNRSLLLTSVDGNNYPACQAYLSQGFKAWDRKKLYIRLFSN